MKKKLFGVWLVFGFVASLAWAYEPGVYVTKENARQDLRARYEENVQKVVLNSLLRTVTETVERTVQGNQLPIVPQIAYVSSQQAVLEMFKIEVFHEKIKQAFRESVDMALEQSDQGVPGAQIQQNVINHIDEVLKPMVDEPQFRRLIELTLQSAMLQQQKIAYQHAVNQQIQQAVMQQAMKAHIQQALARQQILQKQIEQEYIKALYSSQVAR